MDMKLIIAFHNFANASKNGKNLSGSIKKARDAGLKRGSTVTGKGAEAPCAIFPA
jgi:hypothetical protein